MSKGEFYRGNELVQLIHASPLFGGKHEGYRAVHANGRFLAGTFTATPEAANISRAPHFSGTPVPVTARFSPASGDPEAAPSPVFAMATKFYLQDGTVADLIAIMLPCFPVSTVDAVVELLTAASADPTTGQLDASRFRAFIESHPAAARFIELLVGQPAPKSLAETNYRALHAFRFTNADSAETWARYHWEPEAGLSSQPPESLAALSSDAMLDEIEDRTRSAPVRFFLDLQLAQHDDPLADISVPWPDDRTCVRVGVLSLERPVTTEDLHDPIMVHDPTRLTDGIDLHPDDEIIAARRGAYAASVAERTGGWSQRAPVLCPFATTDGP